MKTHRVQLTIVLAFAFDWCEKEIPGPFPMICIQHIEGTTIQF